MNAKISYALVLGSIILLSCFTAHSQIIKVTLLGTGCPAPVMNRFGPSIMVEAGDRKFIFDAGRGVIQRLAQIKVQYKEIQGVFLTHLHSDHVVGLPDFWLTGWLNSRRDRPLQVWGPKGTKKMMSNLREAFEEDIKFRLYEDRASPDGVAIETKDIAEGVVYEESGIKVTAFEVDHGPTKPAFGYRIDYRGRSVVLSGDTRYSENLIKYAKGADLLIHEVVSLKSLKERERGEEWEKMIISHHTTPEQAGEIFSKVKPRLAIYSHIVLPSAIEQDIIPPTRKIYSGLVELGEDLMVIEVGEKIEIRRPPRSV